MANSTHATRGRRGRTRIATKLPTTAPTPPAVRIVAQAPAPPRRSSAIAGPRTIHPAKVRFPIPKKTTDAQSHVRDVNSCQPSRSSVKNPGASVVSRAATRIRRRRSAQTKKLTASTASAMPGLASNDDRASERRAEHADDVPREPLEGVRLLEAVRADRLGDEADLGRKHEPEPEAVDGLERDDRADTAEPSEHARGGRRLRRALDDAGADENQVPGQAVGEDAAADHDERLDPLADGEDDAERGGRPDVEHREGERDPGHPVADRGDHRPGEEQAEVALPEGAEAVVERDRHGH